MPLPQPRGVINFLLLFLFGGGGWFLAAWLKTTRLRQPPADSPVAADIPGNTAGIFAADALSLRAAEKAGAREFDTLLARYGTGSRDLCLLVLPLMEKWIASDAGGALTDGLPRCRDHAPDALPGVMALLAARREVSPASLLAAIPSGPLHAPCLAPCLATMGTAWGRAGTEEPLATAGTGNRVERTLFLQEWHRGRASADAAAASKSASTQKDPDDREAALRGCLLARGVSEPEATLREAARREDFLEIAGETLRVWLPRDPSAAWNFANGFKNDPRLPALAAALLRAEAGRRRLSESLPELTSLLGRLFPEGNPHEVEAFLIPALLQEDPAGPRRYLAGLPGKTDLFHRPAGVILFDALCASDPAGAWRFAEASVEASGGKDDRTVNHWTSASLREHATPAQRIGAGFPDYSDMAVLARLWVKADAPAALSTFCGEKVPASLQKLAIEMALSPAGAHIPPDDLKEWAKRHSPRMLKIVTVWLDQTEAR